MMVVIIGGVVAAAGLIGWIVSRVLRARAPLELSQSWLAEHRADYGGHRD